MINIFLINHISKFKLTDRVNEKYKSLEYFLIQQIQIFNFLVYCNNFYRKCKHKQFDEGGTDCQTLIFHIYFSHHLAFGDIQSNHTIKLLLNNKNQIIVTLMAFIKLFETTLFLNRNIIMKDVRKYKMFKEQIFTIRI